MIILNILFIIGFFGILYFISDFIYKKLVSNKLLEKKVHPFTKKVDKSNFYDVIRIILFLGVTIYSAFALNLYATIVLCFMFLTFMFQFKRNLNQKQETVLIELEYTDEEMKCWKDSFQKQKKKFSSTIVTKKIVITNRFIYSSPFKKYSIERQALDNLYLLHIKDEKPFIVLEYGMNDLVLRRNYIFIPDRYSQSLKQLKKILK